MPSPFLIRALTSSSKKIELLAPAGNFEKLEIAFHYGADAAYIGGRAFSLRKFSGNFTLEDMNRAVSFAHEQNKKIYVACNIFARNRDLPVLSEARRRAPGIPIHLSAQANTVNFESARFWTDLGVTRILPEMIRAKIASLKIEGRMKGINYTAAVVKVYREAVDRYYADPDAYAVKPEWIEELNKISRRGYCTGFYFGHPNETVPNYDAAGYAGENRFLGRVIGSGADGVTVVDVRNRIFEGDAVEIMRPGRPTTADTVKVILDANGQALPVARSGTRAFLGLTALCQKNDLIRRVDKKP